ncbi:aminoacyl-tRNA hydrolase [Mycoplasmopsis cricetuli]|uniref:aminoacyl-tRNA hydrolase n=1 Tax=Mycoplasmopsis cricetuli TaxID=171283 RepID=UPI0004726CAC|nr:aminoacyl-tRNA hydrolase [Mycoplasmopsis cricetuli]
MKLIVGLGNPGDLYKYTRHNVGFLAIDRICEKLEVTLNKNKFNGNYIKIDDIILAKPMTYMNNSGNFILALAKYYDIQNEDILIIQDEKDFPLGKSTIKIGGSGGSHNGVNDVIQKLGTSNFKRIKIGIKTPFEGQLKDFVLGKFSIDEYNKINLVLDKVADACISYIHNDIHVIMNKFNQKNK